MKSVTSAYGGFPILSCLFQMERYKPHPVYALIQYHAYTLLRILYKVQIMLHLLTVGFIVKHPIF